MHVCVCARARARIHPERACVCGQLCVVLETKGFLIENAFLQVSSRFLNFKHPPSNPIRGNPRCANLPGCLSSPFPHPPVNHLNNEPNKEVMDPHLQDRFCLNIRRSHLPIPRSPPAPPDTQQNVPNAIPSTIPNTANPFADSSTAPNTANPKRVSPSSP